MQVKFLRLIVALTLLLPSPAALAAQWSDWEEEFDEEKKPWKEIQAQLPPFPKPENLVFLDAGAATPHKFYIDAASVSVGEDGVVRYTTVVKTGGGATNISFEGMRCRTREQKLYATGRGDGTWVRARDTRWQRILMRDLTPHHWMLYREFFCPSPTLPTPPKQAVEALRRGVGLAQSRATDQ